MYYGFDIGGSKIALGVFNQERRLQWEKRVATPKSSYEDFLQAVEALVREADERFDQQGSVGIGIPGMPETADGTLYAANVPAASGRPLAAGTLAAYSVPSAVSGIPGIPIPTEPCWSKRSSASRTSASTAWRKSS